MVDEKKALRVVLVGHCTPDAWALKNAVRRAIPEAECLPVNDESHLMASLDSADLLLINRSLDGDFVDESGVAMIARLREARAAKVLISNFPEAQAEAEGAGAKPGFGKSEMNKQKASERLRAAVGL